MANKELDRDLLITRIVFLVTIVIIQCLVAVVFAWMWNATLPRLFSLNQIDYVQSFIFVALFYFVVAIFKAK